MERPTVVIELADDARAARDLSAGGVFVPGCTLKINSDCTLLVRCPTEEIELHARVVYVDPNTGAGLELVGFSPAMRDHVTKLMTAWSAPAPAHEPEPEAPAVEAAQPIDDEPLDLGFDPEAPLPEAEGASDENLTEEEKADPVKRSKVKSLHERLRGLTLAQAIKHASSPDPQERILLERYYGKNVWEPLLRNPRLSPPEVARIARMGTLPRTMVEIIVSNGAWLQIPEIRRALLNNPRLGTDQILRVLRLMPKPELKLASTMAVYPYAVRDAAKRLLKEQGGG